MKFIVKDKLDRKYDVEAPEGTDIEKVLQLAEERLGIKVTPVVEQENPTANDRSGEVDSEIAHRSRIEADLREAREEGKSARQEAAAELARERASHAETNKARMKALERAEAATIDVLRRALDDERKAREAAERRDSKPVIVENKMPEPVPHKGWLIRVIERDANGFVRVQEVVPK